jgi:hypothetical protein
MMMRGEDLMGDDAFWNVAERERKETDKLQRECMQLQAEIEVNQRVDSLRHAPGYEEFVKALKALHALAREKLLGDDRLTNDGLREQRGRVRGLESVLALLTSAKVNETLAKQLAERKTLLAEALRRRPIPKNEDQPKVTT